jgi:hypothetical protein
MLEMFYILPVIVFMLKRLACKWEQPISYFVTSSTPSADLLKNLLLKCIKIASEYVALLSNYNMLSRVKKSVNGHNKTSSIC